MSVLEILNYPKICKHLRRARSPSQLQASSLQQSGSFSAAPGPCSQKRTEFSREARYSGPQPGEKVKGEVPQFIHQPVLFTHKNKSKAQGSSSELRPALPRFVGLYLKH